MAAIPEPSGPRLTAHEGVLAVHVDGYWQAKQTTAQVVLEVKTRI